MTMNSIDLTPKSPISIGRLTNSLMLPAVKYKSGTREWIAITIDYLSLGRFVRTTTVKKKNQDIIKADIINRFLDKKHVSEIKKYIEIEPEFTIPPITVVSFETLEFKALNYGDMDGAETEDEILERLGSVMGIVFLPIHHEFVCLDGNHRVAAIKELAEEAPEMIQGSYMLMNVVEEKRKQKIRQDFVDVNQNAKQTTASINTLFNTRDVITRIVADLLSRKKQLEDTTEILSTSVSKNAKDIYTINNIKNAVVELGGYNSQSKENVTKLSEILQKDQKARNRLEQRVDRFFDQISRNEHVSKCFENYDRIPLVREQSILTSGTGIIIAARLAGLFFDRSESTMAENDLLSGLFKFDWSRSNKFFIGKLMTEDGKILNSHSSISTTTKAMADILLNLQEEEDNTIDSAK